MSQTLVGDLIHHRMMVYKYRVNSVCAFSGGGSGLQSCHGLISVFEIFFESTETGVKYTLNLHGSCALPSVPHSCTVMTPPLDSLGSIKVSQDPAPSQNQADAPHRLLQLTDGGTTELEWEDSWPIVLVGNQTGVTAYRIFVDDDGVLGMEVAKTVLDLLPDSAELSLPGALPQVEEECEALNIPKMLGDCEDGQEGKVMKRTKEVVSNVPGQRLVSKVVGNAQAYTKSPVVAIAAMEGMIIASEFLGSLTIFKAEFKVKPEKETPPLWAPMVPLAVDRMSTCVQAVVPLSKSIFLVSVHPFGFVVLHHDLSTMEEQIEQWREEFLRHYESGRPVAADRPSYWGHQDGDSASDTDESASLQTGMNNMECLNSLMFGAACRIPQIVGGFSRGFLGMQIRDANKGKGPEVEAASSESQITSSSNNCVMYYTGSGSIGMCRVISQEDAECLAKIQNELHSRQSDGKLSCVTEHDHRSMFLWSEHRSQSAMLCIDGDFTAKGLQEAEVDSVTRQRLRQLCNPGRSLFIRNVDQI